MSEELYPLSLISRCRAIKQDRVIRDEFEAGNTSTRRGWGVGAFKRMLEFTHAPLTRDEFQYLKDFYEARGTYDSFLFRDNVNRDGIIRVRFADALQMEYQGAARPLTVRLVETDVNAVNLAGVTDAAGAAPLVWFDATQELFYKHAGTEYFIADTNIRNRVLGYTAPWTTGTPALTSSPGLGYRFNGSTYGKTSINISQLTGTAPDFTLFMIARASTASSMQAFVSLAGHGATVLQPQGVYIGLATNGNWYAALSSVSSVGPGLGGANVADTWMSVCLTGWSSAALYVNTVSASIGSLGSFNYNDGPMVIGALSDGSVPANPSNSMTNCDVAHAMLFNAKLSAAQVKALHNLLAPDYGIANVP